jgi:4-amino-4-deoxy-L-arabinose transferase-like glycosyltransferase
LKATAAALPDRSPPPPTLARFGLVAAFLFAAWATFFHLGDFPLLSPDEGRNAEVAREMKAAGAWLVPTYDGAVYLDKPAFFFKAVALSLAAFGDNEAAARLPSALSGFGVLVMVFLFCRRAYGNLTAALAMVIVASTPLFMAFSRIVIFDMMLALFVCAAILAAYLAEEYEGSRRRNWYLAATLAAGLATLVKGPVGFLVPLLVMGVFHLVTGRREALKRFFAPAHILLFLAVVLPWFVGLSLACPDFPYYGIMKESIARFTTPAFRRTQPFYYYALIIAGCFFAWSVALPEAIRAAVRERARLSRPDRLFVVWAIVVVAFFSLSQSKLPGYILTGVIALGVLVARVFAEALQGLSPAAENLVRRAGVGLALAAGLLAAPVLMLIIAPEALPRPRWLTAESVALFGPLLPGLAISLGGTAAVALLASTTRNTKFALAAFLSFPVLLLTANFDVITRHAGIKSAHALYERLPPDLPADTEFACMGCMPHGLPFYLGRLVTVFTVDGGELTSNYVLFALGSGKPWPERLVPLTRMNSYLATRPHPVLVLAARPHRAVLEPIAQGRGAPVLDLGSDYVGALLPAVVR